MSTIRDDKVREVRERSDIVSVISDYVALRRAGSNYQGLCPFHSEKTPSFNVNPARSIFHCFGCGVGGDVYAFIMRIEGLSFPDAVKFLAKRVGVVIEEQPISATEKRRVEERELLFRVMERAAQYYRRVLTDEPSGEPGRSYLGKRGVLPDTAAAYRLGYASDRRDGLVRYLQQAGVPLSLAEKLGLIRQKDGGSWYDLFRNRLLFTIADYQGRAIGFGGRVLDDSLPKYINSPESPIYHKSDVLFGLDLAKQAMREKRAAIVVEGYFDHLALYQGGVKNVVATCGTALTDSHVKLLQRYGERAYTLFDADKAGKKATTRAMDMFLQEGFPAFVVELTAGEDPDSFICNEGVEAFMGRLTSARPSFEFFFRDLLRQGDLGNVEGRVRAVEELVPRLQKIANEVERDLYVREICRLLGIPETTLRKRLGGRALSQAEIAPRRQTPAKGIAPQEMLLSLMGKYPEVAGRVQEYGVERLFEGDFVSAAETVVDQVASGAVDWPSILQSVESPELRGRLSAVLMNEEYLEGIDPQKAFDDCCRSIEKVALADAKGLRRELALLDPESERYWEILRQIDALSKKKSKLF